MKIVECFNEMHCHACPVKSWCGDLDWETHLCCTKEFMNMEVDRFIYLAKISDDFLSDTRGYFGCENELDILHEKIIKMGKEPSAIVPAGYYQYSTRSCI